MFLDCAIYYSAEFYLFLTSFPLLTYIAGGYCQLYFILDLLAQNLEVMSEKRKALIKILKYLIVFILIGVLTAWVVVFGI